MEKKINDKKLKIKYIIGNYKDLDDFPTDEDILYELTKEFCMKNSKELLFTNESLKNKYSLDDKGVLKFVNGMLKKNIIKEIKKQDDLITYEVIENIFI